MIIKKDEAMYYNKSGNIISFDVKSEQAMPFIENGFTASKKDDGLYCVISSSVIFFNCKTAIRKEKPLHKQKRVTDIDEWSEYELIDNVYNNVNVTSGICIIEDTVQKNIVLLSWKKSIVCDDYIFVFKWIDRESFVDIITRNIDEV